MVLMIIGAILFIAGVCMMIFGWRRNQETVGFFLAMASTIVVALGLCIYAGNQSNPAHPVPIEYPASEYELKLRIVEFEGKRDTTYVLVEKIKE